MKLLLKIGLNSTALVVIAVMFLVYIELFLNIFNFSYDWTFLNRVPDSLILESGQRESPPNIFHTNKRGFRDFVSSDNNIKKIMLLGDSIIEGFNIPYAKRFSEIIEEKTAVDMINMGEGGKEIRGAILRLEEFYPKYLPDRVIVFISANDVYGEFLDFPGPKKYVEDSFEKIV